MAHLTLIICFVAALGDTSDILPFPPRDVPGVPPAERLWPVAATAREAAERSVLQIGGNTIGRPHQYFWSRLDTFPVYLDTPDEDILKCANMMVYRFPVYQNGRAIRTISVRKEDGGFRKSGEQAAGDATRRLLELQAKLPRGTDIAVLNTNRVGTYVVTHKNLVATQVRPLDHESWRILDARGWRRLTDWKIGKPVGIRRAAKKIKAVLRGDWEAMQHGRHQR